MNKLISALVCLVLMSGASAADPVLDEDTVKGISVEIKHAVKNNDMTVFRKYLYRGSKLVVDLDPSSSAGLTEVSYDDYMSLMQMALPFMSNADIQDEIISLSIDEARNQATIKEKSSITMEMMGSTIRDVSVSETTYGIVAGQIKVLSASDELISSEVIDP